MVTNIRFKIFGKRAKKAANLVNNAENLKVIYSMALKCVTVRRIVRNRAAEKYIIFGKRAESQPTWRKTLKIYKLFILWNRAQDCAEPSSGEGQAEWLRNAESAAAGPGNGARPPSSLLHQRHPRNTPAGRQCQSSQAEAGRRR
jgi:hypothetical protein